MPADRPRSPLDLSTNRRIGAWDAAIEAIESYASGVRALPVAPQATAAEVRAVFAGMSPDKPMQPEQAIAWLVAASREYQLHVAHPGYFGLFVPAPTTIGVIADALASALNPQLGSWGHAPFAVEAEQWVINTIGQRLGYTAGAIEGTVTTGGSEANLTAMVVALRRANPAVTIQGVRGLRSPPCVYVSEQSHFSWRKAVRIAGLGDDALCVVPCDSSFRIDLDALLMMLRRDRALGRAPFMIVATVGATACGAIDNVAALRAIADSAKIWLHADAAWAGAAALSTTWRHVVAGLSDADSVTIDAHKWLSVPMGAGLYISRHRGTLHDVFAMHPGYIPANGDSEGVHEPYQESVQGSRRFNGLKIMLSLLVHGWKGVAGAVDNSFALGTRLANGLALCDWTRVNDTPLPLLCFRDGGANGVPGNHHSEIAAEVNRRGQVWVSTVQLPRVGEAIRACVCNHRTTPRDVDALLEELNLARAAVRALA